MKANKTTKEEEYQTTGEEISNQRVALIWLHIIKSINKKIKWQESRYTYQY
jgi:hypothetical protein